MNCGCSVNEYCLTLSRITSISLCIAGQASWIGGWIVFSAFYLGSQPLQQKPISDCALPKHKCCHPKSRANPPRNDHRNDLGGSYFFDLICVEYVLPFISHWVLFYSNHAWLTLGQTFWQRFSERLSEWFSHSRMMCHDRVSALCSCVLCVHVYWGWFVFLYCGFGFGTKCAGLASRSWNKLVQDIVWSRQIPQDSTQTATLRTILTRKPKQHHDEFLLLHPKQTADCPRRNGLESLTKESQQLAFCSIFFVLLLVFGLFLCAKRVTWHVWHIGSQFSQQNSNSESNTESASPKQLADCCPMLNRLESLTNSLGQHCFALLVVFVLPIAFWALPYTFAT